MVVAFPRRSTISTVRVGRGPLALKHGHERFDPIGHFQRSLSNLDRVSVKELRKFSRTIPARKAIRRVANGVLRMPWTILPPADMAEDDAAVEQAKRVKKALQRPNAEDHNLYSKFIRALIHEMITIGYAAVERQPGTEDTQPFWLWAVNAENIRVNPDWTASQAGIIPRYYDFSAARGTRNAAIPLFDQELFIIQPESTTYELVPPSPLEVAYRLIQAWMGTGDFQQSTTTQAVRDYIIVLKGAGEDEVKAFRDYWQAEVEGTGNVPIVGGDGVEVVKLGAKNDEELYPKYTEYLLRLIAVAFDLATRDYNIVEPDNKATANVAADSTFQDAIMPMALVLQEHLQAEVIDLYAPGYELSITDSEKRSEQEEATTATMLYEKNVLTRNEARLRTGEESIGAIGDVFADGSKLNPDEGEGLEDFDLEDFWSNDAKKTSQPGSSTNGKAPVVASQRQKGKQQQISGSLQLSLFR